LHNIDEITEGPMTESIKPPRPENLDDTPVEEMTEKERRERLNRLDRDRADDTGGAGDVSPHHGGRAQPGDVLGIETGGETTAIGDTSEDENERRRKAEKDR
jgi:hypothetical protein